MTIRPAQPSRKSPPAGTTKGMDVVMMNDFEQRHHTNKSRSHSPFGHIGSPTTPLNFEQLFLQGQFPLNSELSQHDQTMLQAQMLNGMRSTGMAPKSKQQPQSSPSLAMLDQLRQAYNRGDQDQAFARGDRDQAGCNARAFTAAGAPHQQQYQAHDTTSEPSSLALLQQKFAQLDRHKAEIQKSATPPEPLHVYPTQWAMSVQQQHGNPMQPPSAPYPEPRHFVPTSGGFYSFQQPQPLQSQVMPPAPAFVDVPEQFHSKQEISWRPSQDLRPAGTQSGAWKHGNTAPPSSSEMGSMAPLVYMSQQQPGKQFHQTIQQHRVPDFAVPPPASFTSFQLNGPPAPDMASLGDASAGISSRCDDSEMSLDNFSMSLDNFSGRVSGHMPPPSQAQSSVPIAPQIPFSNNFHMLPQSSKSAFTTFTRYSSNLNPASSEGVVTKSLLFNDTYRRSQEMPDSIHDDVDTELHL